MDNDNTLAAKPGVPAWRDKTNARRQAARRSKLEEAARRLGYDTIDQLAAAILEGVLIVEPAKPRHLCLELPTRENEMEVRMFNRHPVAPDGELIDAVAACDACTKEGQVLPGHLRCVLPSRQNAEAERRGRIGRRFEGERWRYYLRWADQ